MPPELAAAAPPALAAAAPAPRPARLLWRKLWKRAAVASVCAPLGWATVGVAIPRSAGVCGRYGGAVGEMGSGRWDGGQVRELWQAWHVKLEKVEELQAFVRQCAAMGRQISDGSALGRHK